MKCDDLIKKYIDFFKKKKHKEISGSSLIPEHDPSALFISAGMHPLVPFLLGQKHPSGSRLVNVQNCIRTSDIDEVGDVNHLTFLKMLGNWSLGDYWKKESIEMSFEFLTKVLKFDSEKIHVTCFKGDKDFKKDLESANVWMSLGVPKQRIYFLGKKDNWWGPAGKTGPCGPDTEIFIDTGQSPCSLRCRPGCNCGKYFEVWNNVFLEYNKDSKGKYAKLEQRNVDTGMGVERTVAMMNGFSNVYEVDGIKEIYDFIVNLSKDKKIKSLRIVCDHLIAACYILDAGVSPLNLDQGYVLRRLIRRAIRYGRLLGIIEDFCYSVGLEIIKVHKLKNKKFILDELKLEEEKFSKALVRGMREFERMKVDKKINGKESFMLFSSYGFPIEMIKEICAERKIKVDEKGFSEEFREHQKMSRKGAEKRFKGGLSDAKFETVKLHTATHLLYKALQEVLGEKVKQKGSNITAERLRFDFSFDRKVSSDELDKVEKIVNSKIKAKMPVKKEVMTLSEAKKKGVTGLFEHKYGEKIFVYSIGNYSKEICMGPHVKNTSELGRFKITKEQSSSGGVRRIKAKLERSN